MTLSFKGPRASPPLQVPWHVTSIESLNLHCYQCLTQALTTQTFTWINTWINAHEQDTGHDLWWGGLGGHRYIWGHRHAVKAARVTRTQAQHYKELQWAMKLRQDTETLTCTTSLAGHRHACSKWKQRQDTDTDKYHRLPTGYIFQHL